MKSFERAADRRAIDGCLGGVRERSIGGDPATAAFVGLDYSVACP